MSRLYNCDKICMEMMSLEQYALGERKDQRSSDLEAKMKGSMDERLGKIRDQSKGGGSRDERKERSKIKDLRNGKKGRELRDCRLDYRFANLFCFCELLITVSTVIVYCIWESELSNDAKPKFDFIWNLIIFYGVFAFLAFIDFDQMIWREHKDYC